MAARGLDYLVPDDWLFNGREVLQRGEKNVTKLGTSNVFHETS